MIEAEIPFRIVVLANLVGKAPRLPRIRDRRLINVTPWNFSRVLAALKPEVSLDHWRVSFQKLEDFSQARILEQIQIQGVPQEEAATIAQSIVLTEDYNSLRASWYGLSYLVQAIGDTDHVAIQVWSVSKKELWKDFVKAPEFDQSVFFKRIYEEGLGTFGGGAVGCLVADYYLTSHPEDIELAEGMSQVASFSRAPVLIGAAPEFVRLRSWNDLSPDFTASWFNRARTQAKWNSCRNSLESRGFLFPFLPRFRCISSEDAGSPTCWLNSSFLAGAAVALAFRDEEFTQPDTANVVPVPIEFEFAPPQQLIVNLAAIGLNAMRLPFSSQLLSTFNAAVDHTYPASLRRLDALLVACRIVHRLRTWLRYQQDPTNADSLQVLVTEWLDNCVELRKGTPLCRDWVSVEGYYDVRLILKIAFPWHSEHGERHCPFYSALLKKKGWSIIEALPQHTTPTFRVCVAADFDCGTYGVALPSTIRGSTKIINCENFDDVLDTYVRTFDLRLSGADLRLKFSGLEGFDPEQLVFQIPLCKPLLDDWSQLEEVACLTDVCAQGWPGLEKIARQTGGLRALALKIEAWMSVMSNPDSSPIPPTFLSDRLDYWIKVDRDSLQPVPAALLTYQEWVERMPRIRSGSQVLADIFDEIFEAIDVQLRPIYENASFRQLEKTWRGLGWLVQTLTSPNVEICTLLTNWNAKFQQREANDSPLHAVILNELRVLPEGDSADRQAVGTFVLDYCFHPAEAGLRTLGHILELTADARVITVCGLHPAAFEGSSTDSIRLFPEMGRLATSKGARTLLLVEGESTIPRDLGGWVRQRDRLRFVASGRSLKPTYTVSSVYPVTAALAGLSQEYLRLTDAHSRCGLLWPSLKRYGLGCRPLGNAVVVSRETLAIESPPKLRN